ATMLGIPCLTLRDTTERPVTVTHGTNRIIGSNPARILEESLETLKHPPRPNGAPPYWDGHAAERIIGILDAYRQALTPAWGPSGHGTGAAGDLRRRSPHVRRGHRVGSLCPESRRGLGLPVDGLAAGHGKVLRTSDLLSDGTRRESAGSGRIAAGLPLQPALRALSGLDALCQLWGCPDGPYRGPAGAARDRGESRDRPRRLAHRAPAPKIAAPGLDVEAAQGLDATRSAARARDALEEISVEAPKPGPASPERTADRPHRGRRAARRFLSRLL